MAGNVRPLSLSEMQRGWATAGERKGSDPLVGGDERAIYDGLIAVGVWGGKEPPTIPWMVDGLFARGTVVLVGGDGGLGKSLLMQQLCTAAATGIDWIGLRVERCRSLLIACEDDRDELWRRQARINRAFGLTMQQVEDGGFLPWARIGQDNALARLDRGTWSMQPTTLIAAVEQAALDFKCRIVVIDTATQTFRGNQNDENQVIEYIALLRRLAIRIDGLVIVTKHPSMAGRALGTGESGSVAWTNSVRSRVYLAKDKHGNLSLKTMKLNSGPIGAEIPLEWRGGIIQRVDQAPPPRWGD